MISAKSLVYRIHRKIDRLDSEKKKAIRTVDICSALTEAQNYLLKDRVQKYEIDTRNRYEISELEVKGKKILASLKDGSYVADLPIDIYRDLGMRVIAFKDGCGEKIIPLTKINSGSYQKSITNPFWSSSFAWEQAFGDEANGKMHVYSDDFEVKSIIVDYIRKPNEIHCPSLVDAPAQYVDWNGIVQVEDSGWELDQLVDEGVNIAAMILSGDIGDYNEFRLKYEGAMRTEEMKMI